MARSESTDSDGPFRNFRLIISVSGGQVNYVRQR